MELKSKIILFSLNICLHLKCGPIWKNAKRKQKIIDHIDLYEHF